jgi:hypothetical protein
VKAGTSTQFFPAESRMMQVVISKSKWSAQEFLPVAFRPNMHCEVDIPDDAPSIPEGKGMDWDSVVP